MQGLFRKVKSVLLLALAACEPPGELQPSIRWAEEDGSPPPCQAHNEPLGCGNRRIDFRVEVSSDRVVPAEPTDRTSLPTGVEWSLLRTDSIVWSPLDGAATPRFNGLRHGSAYRLAAEVFPCATSEDCSSFSSEIEYLGRSAPFEFVHGLRSERMVEVVLRRRPVADAIVVEGAVQVEGQSRVNGPCVDLGLRSERASHVLLGRSPSALQDGTRVTCELRPEGLCRAEGAGQVLAVVEQGQGDRWVIKGWPMCQAAAEFCSQNSQIDSRDHRMQTPPACPDGEYSVFSWLRSADSPEFPSQENPTIWLDQQPPTLRLSLPDRPVRGGPVPVSLSSLEPLAACPELCAEPAGGDGEPGRSCQPSNVTAKPVPCPEGGAAEHRCCYVLQAERLVPAAGSSASFSFLAEASDKLGNTTHFDSAVQAAGDSSGGVVVIDRTPPAITACTGCQEEPVRLRAGEKWESHLVFSEAIDPESVVLTLGGEEVIDACSPEAEPHRWRCGVTALERHGDGRKGVRLSATDLAGNPLQCPGALASALCEASSGSALLASLELDVQPLALTSQVLRLPEYRDAASPERVLVSLRDPFIARPAMALPGVVDAGAVSVTVTLVSNKPRRRPSLIATECPGSSDVRQPRCVPASTPARAVPFGSAPGFPEAFEAAGTEFHFSLRASELSSGSEWCLQARFEDELEWCRQYPLPTRIEVPAPPRNGVDLARTVFERVPWGAARSGGEPRYSVKGVLLPADPGESTSAPSDVLFASDRQGTRVVGSSRGRPALSAGAEFEVDLERLPEEQVELFVATVGASGAVSPFERVRHGRWVATLNGKGDVARGDNPHAAHAYGAVPGAWRAAGALLPAEALALPGDGRVVTTSGRLAFEELLRGAAPAQPDQEQSQRVGSVEAQPPALRGHALAYDARRGVTVMFGGEVSLGDTTDELWEWDGLRWRQVPRQGNWPEPRAWAAMAYDSDKAAVVLHGGQLDLNRIGEIWEWDGDTWRERSRSAATDAAEEDPDCARRSHHAMAYDPDAHVMVSFGGVAQGAGAPNGLTCLLEGTTWRSLTGLGEGPEPRQDSAMTWVTASFAEALTESTLGGSSEGAPLSDGGLVLSGGMSEALRPLADTWLYRQGRWARVGALARPVSQQALVFDWKSERLVSLGGTPGTPFGEGHCAGVVPLVQEWHRGDAGWSLTALDARACLTSTSCRLAAPAVFDGGRGQILLFGGMRCGDGGIASSNETWLLDAATWERPASTQADAPLPEARSEHRLLSLPGKDPLLVGGYLFRQLSQPAAEGMEACAPPASPPRWGYGTADLCAAWRWTGSAWALQPIGGPVPTARADFAWAPLDEQKLIVFGGRRIRSLGDTQLLEVDSEGTWTWSAPAPCAESPPPRSGGLLVEARGAGLLLMAGLDPSERLQPSTSLYRWESPCWRVANELQSFPPRDGAAVGVDRLGPVVFGGSALSGGVLGDAWRWTDRGWALLGGPAQPPPRRAHELLELNGALVVLGGADGDGASLMDAWVLSADGWVDVTPYPEASRPTKRQHFAAVNWRNGKGLLFGGRAQEERAGTESGDTWQVSQGVPAQQLSWDLGSWASLQRRTQGEVRLERGAICARLANTSVPVTVQPWNGLGFEPAADRGMAVSSNDPSNTISVELSRERLARAIARDHLGFQLVPSRQADDGHWPARIETDYLEVVLSYVLGATEQEEALGTLCAWP